MEISRKTICRELTLQGFCKMSDNMEGAFLDVIGTKILRLLLIAIQSHLSPADFTPPSLVFLDLRFLQQQLKVVGSFVLFTLSLWLPLKVALLFLLLRFIYIYCIVNRSFPHRNNN